ncbi:MAG: PEGA domain-containing protein [Polyangiaceae bacterium]|nr:PEGA domain-containing protein [Polyangiaceae bacterium]
MRALLTRVLVVVLVCLFASPALARGAKLEIQILDIASPDSIEHARALTLALERAVTRSNTWRIAAGDYSLEVLTAALDCSEPPDEECLKRIAGEIESDRFIFGTLSRSGGEVSVELSYWDEGRVKTSVTTKYPASLDDAAEDGLLKVANRAFVELVGQAGGQILVVAGNGSGEVLIDGRGVGALSAGRFEADVPAGDHEVLVRAPGHRDAFGTVTVNSGQRARLELDLVSTEETIPETATPREERARERREQPPSKKRSIGFGMIGGGAALAVAGVVFAAISAAQREDSEFEEYRSTVPAGEDVCEAAEDRGNDAIVDKCEANVRTRTMAYILTPTGVLIAGVGVALVATSVPKEAADHRARRMMGEVRVGPRGGYLGLGVRF